MSIFTNWGSTKKDRQMKFTCDQMVKNANGSYFRAVDINAPADLVYRWVCQMKVAPYSYDKLDNGGRKSPSHLTDGIDQLKIGDKMMTIFTVKSFVPTKEVTLVMDVPPGKFAAWYVPTSISYKIIEQGHNKTRLVVKYVAVWKETLFGWMERILVVFADFIMMRRQLLNFKKYSERDFYNQKILNKILAFHY